ncbi:hypothetical protein NM208_g661 [Fusarium decemcellulare]|uniref:Uncharacterized protein n=1 Tax=Fusarium decemcellulare TaxID=57161 RepID=A0ACC1SYW2_9HYPO|nr:hypothetical protein NM208_g661 [Fusarium decemcellulare]
MAYNRIAIFGHRGWVSSAIVDALAASGAPITILYRPTSDTSSLPSHVKMIEVNFEDEITVTTALKDVDILISLAGLQEMQKQHAFVKAIPHTNVKLFCPSALAAHYDEQGLRIPDICTKHEVELAAQKAGIPITTVLPGNFAEFALSTLALGVDVPGNRIVFTGDSDQHKLNLCTREYVAAAYASLFATTPISQLKNRSLRISELAPTGQEIASALHSKHGTAPKITKNSSDLVNTKVGDCLQTGSLFALPWYCRKIWGDGRQAEMVGRDTWDIPDYSKTDVTGLIVEGKLKPYRDLPPAVTSYFDTSFRSS